MTISRENQPRRVDFAELFADLDIDPHDEWLHNKREDVSIVLTSMLYKAGVSRAQLAKQLDWKPSRVSRALSGNENLTLNTLAEIINAAGFDFDIRLRRRGEVRAMQPWEAKSEADAMLEQIGAMLGEVKVIHAESAAMKKTLTECTRTMFRTSHYRSATQTTGTQQFSANDSSPMVAHG